MQPEVIEAMRMLPPTAKLAIGVTAAAAYLGKTCYDTVNDVRIQKMDLVNQQQKLEFTQQKAEFTQQKAEFTQKDLEQTRLIAKQADTIERLETKLLATQEELKKKWF